MSEELRNYRRSSADGGDDGGGGRPGRGRIKLWDEKEKKRSILLSSPNFPSPVIIGIKRPYSELSSAQESSNPSQVITRTAVPPDSRPCGSNLIPREGGLSSGPPTTERSLRKIREQNDDSYEDILKLTPPENEDNGPDPNGADFIIRLNEDMRG